MNWRKMVYEMLEASGKPEDAQILEAMKTEVKGYDGLEAQLRVAEKAKTDLETEVTSLKSQGGEKTALETQVSELTKTVKALMDETATAKAQEQKALEEKNRLALHSELLPDMAKAFGTLTGKLLANEFINDGRVLMSDKGLTFRDGGVDYVGKEAIDRIKILHKDSIIGEPGAGTTPPSGPGKTVPSGGDLADKGANELFSMALNQKA